MRSTQASPDDSRSEELREALASVTLRMDTIEPLPKLDGIRVIGNLTLSPETDGSILVQVRLPDLSGDLGRIYPGGQFIPAHPEDLDEPAGPTLADYRSGPEVLNDLVHSELRRTDLHPTDRDLLTSINHRTHPTIVASNLRLRFSEPDTLAGPTLSPVEEDYLALLAHGGEPECQGMAACRERLAELLGTDDDAFVRNLPGEPVLRRAMEKRYTSYVASRWLNNDVLRLAWDLDREDRPATMLALLLDLADISDETDAIADIVGIRGFADPRFVIALDEYGTAFYQARQALLDHPRFERVANTLLADIEAPNGDLPKSSKTQGYFENPEAAARFIREMLEARR